MTQYNPNEKGGNPQDRKQQGYSQDKERNPQQGQGSQGSHRPGQQDTKDFSSGHSNKYSNK